MAKKAAKKAKEAETKEETPKAEGEKPAETLAQPEISIGMVGHVDHGKTTLVKALTGKWTDTHSEELKRGITIRLGYADSIFYKCPKCQGDEAYGTTPDCRKCGGKAERLRTVSFVDAPGHESLMATMLCGSAIIDAALLLVSAAEQCPQPQTKEHLQALEIVGIKDIIVVQNKIDLVSEENARKNYEQIKAFLKGSRYENAPIVPISAMHGVNIDMLISTIESLFKTPNRDPSKSPIMLIARSFDINKPGAEVGKMVGGILGGSLKQGVLKDRDEIEIRPGRDVIEKNKTVWKPIFTTVSGMMTGSRKVSEVRPGGSIAIMTELDPSVVKSDKLVGAVVGLKGKLPPVWYGLNLETHLLKRVVGAKDKLVVEPLKPLEPLMLNVNSAATVGIVNELKRGSFRCTLKRPVCADIGARVTISRRIGNRWRLIGYGILKE